MKGATRGWGSARFLLRAVRLVVVLSLGVVVAAVAVDRWAEHSIRKKLVELAGRVAAQVDPSVSPSIAVSLWERRVSVSGLRLVPSTGAEGAQWRCHGTLDTLLVDGISVFDLVFRRTLQAREVRAHATGLCLTISPEPGAAWEQPFSNDRPWALELDAFALRIQAMRLITAKGDSLRLEDPGLSITGRSLRSGPAGPSGGAQRSVNDLRVEVDSVFGSMVNGYAWSTGRCVFDQRNGVLHGGGVSFAPNMPTEQFSAAQRYEDDVIDARFAPFIIEGVDLDGMLLGKAPSARSVRSMGGDVLVSRDKTKPDGPAINKPLLARLIRMLPEGGGLDSLHLDSLDITYRERADLERGHAEVPFTGIRGFLAGLRNVRSDTASMVIQARCIAFDHAPVALELRTLVQDTTDRFHVKASIGAMPFTALNKATGPLVDIRATEGRMDSLIFRMTADRLRASGAVHMAYQGLKLSSGGRRRREPIDRLQTMVLNSLVHDEYRDGKGVPREGLFTFQRRQDRSLPNYLWSGLREGVKAVLLPEVLTR